MKIVFDETKFIVNEEKKTVTCIISAKFTPYSQQTEVGLRYHLSELTKKFRVAGVSKCHPDDQFSVETGKRIAESRAKKKVYSMGKELGKKFLRYTEILSSDITKMISNMETYHDKEVWHIESLLKQQTNNK